jgi:hypothetical protein
MGRRKKGKVGSDPGNNLTRTAKPGNTALYAAGDGQMRWRPGGVGLLPGYRPSYPGPNCQGVRKRQVRILGHANYKVRATTCYGRCNYPAVSSTSSPSSTSTLASFSIFRLRAEASNISR